MTDQIPADKVRAMATRFRRQMLPNITFAECAVWERAAEAVESLLPDPPLPTLADMTPEERAACQWMQADTNGGRDVISNPCYDQGRATILLRDGTSIPVGMEKITPRPDLPRMEWPGTGQDGEEATKVDYVSVAGGRTAYGPWTVARLRKKPAPAPVPPNTLAVGSEWEDVDALARACRESGRDQIVVIDNSGGAYVWDEKAGWWEGSASPQYSPFTILHAGLEADQ